MEQKNILLIEKGQHCSYEIKKVLDEAKFNVLRVQSLSEAIEKLSQGDIQLIITSHWGEEKESLRFLTNRVPSVMVTDRKQAEAFAKHSEMLTTCCLDYTEVQERLLSAVNKALSRFRLDMEMNEVSNDIDQIAS